MKVDSSTIYEVIYNGTDLTITFASGGAYVYSGVPAEVYAAFMDSESKGRFFHANIKGKYDCAKLS